VILSGELAKRFGKRFELSISTPAEAIRALCANFKDFAAFVSDSEKRGVGYRVIVDKADIGTTDDIHNPFSRTVRIVPVIMGAKSGVFQVIIGAALIAAAFWTGGVSLTAAGLAYSGLAGQLAFAIGTSLILGGISQMLAPMPKAGKPAEAVNNQPSYVFNGPVNTTSQGQCVPVGYGRLIVGSAVISAGFTSDEYSSGAVV